MCSMEKMGVKMSEFKVKELDIQEAFIIEPFHVSDNRGNVKKLINKSDFLNRNINFSDSEVMVINSNSGVLRGIHFQKKQAQKKMLYCLHGELFVTIVDLRKESDTYGNALCYRLNESNPYGVIIPPGCGLGSLAIKDCIICLMNEGNYFPEFDSGVRWDDSKLAIPWPIEELKTELIVSKKDQEWGSFEEI